MSHPYWPQAMYGFRRQKAAPVPDAYGDYDDFGAESMMAPTRTYGSMSPKYDWATPRYIRNEPSGMGDFGADGCAGTLKDAIVNYLADKICKATKPSATDYASQLTGGLACTGAKVALNGLLGALAGIVGTDDEIRQRVRSVFSMLPSMTVMGTDFNVTDFIRGAADEAVDAALAACPNLGAPGEGAGGTYMAQQFITDPAMQQQLCAGMTYPATQKDCEIWGQPWGLQLAMVGPANIQPMLQVGQGLTQQQIELLAAGKMGLRCAGGVAPVETVIDSYGNTAMRCPGTGAVPTVVSTSGGGSTMLLLAGAAVAAFLLLK